MQSNAEVIPALMLNRRTKQKEQMVPRTTKQEISEPQPQVVAVAIENEGSAYRSSLDAKLLQLVPILNQVFARVSHIVRRSPQLNQ